MYRVALVQFAPRLKDIDHNLERMQELGDRCNADLIVYPELCTTGYVFVSSDELYRVSESAADSLCISEMAEFCADKDCSVVFGFAERSADQVFNSSVLINPDGSIHIYRKIHLFSREKLLFSPGDQPFAVHAAKHGVRVGMMICFDWQYPEAMRTLALKGAQVICHPANLVLPWCQRAMTIRSLENRVFSITANRVGKEINGKFGETFTGKSQILNTRGEILQQMGETEEGFIIAEIDPILADDKTVTEYNNAFSDRRPQFYELG
ncbi:MAG: beta-ureidopropionase [Candidatus Cloacimonetes bacterium]|nr:beta-ureidopropionase [Candidatus Cloacimonadota bacterium]